MRVKRFVYVAVTVVCLSFAANAEMSPSAIGLRMGGGSLLGAEVNYQTALGANRLEIGASYSSESQSAFGVNYSTHYFGAAAAYQWHWNIDGGFNWYAGPGAAAGFWSYSYSYNYNVSGVNTRVNANENGFYVNVGGQVGIEYNFNVSNVPLIISLDSRPMFGLLNSAGFGWDIALGVRYTF
jgi:hypothetical protein